MLPVWGYYTQSCREIRVRSLYRHMFSPLLGESLGVKWLGHFNQLPSVLPPLGGETSSSSKSSSRRGTVGLLNLSRSNGLVVVSRCGLNFHFSTKMGNIFPCAFFFFLIYLFIFGCVGSLFPCEGFLQLRRAGATPHRGARAYHCRGLSCCGARAPDAQAQ